MKREHRPCAREMQPGNDILASHHYAATVVRASRISPGVSFAHETRKILRRPQYRQ